MVAEKLVKEVNDLHAARFVLLVLQGFDFVFDCSLAAFDAFVNQDGNKGSPENLQIEREGAVVDIFNVVLNLVKDTNIISAAGLSEAGDSWQNVISAALITIHILIIIRDPWSWADQRHLSAQNIN